MRGIPEVGGIKDEELPGSCPGAQARGAVFSDIQPTPRVRWKATLSTWPILSLPLSVRLRKRKISQIP